jgi:hypothetical protein
MSSFIATTINRAFDRLLSPSIKHRSERTILMIAIVSYLAHLLLILLVNQGVLDIESKFFSNPIAAIYTPFSFILIYEVYLLIFFLPKSISFYIGKQYEIITLIVIRRIFKDIANLELSSDWFSIKYDLQFTYDVLTSLILFVLIFLFYREIRSRSNPIIDDVGMTDEKMNHFILLKKGIAVLLVPTLFVLAFVSLFNWVMVALSDYQNGLVLFSNLNTIFFDEFFTVLIIVDVTLLLASFFYSDQFHKIIRNSGFIISTILIKVSFSVEGLINNALIIVAVLFGFLILIIHNQFEKLEK